MIALNRNQAHSLFALAYSVSMFCQFEIVDIDPRGAVGVRISQPNSPSAYSFYRLKAGGGYQFVAEQGVQIPTESAETALEAELEELL